MEIFNKNLYFQEIQYLNIQMIPIERFENKKFNYFIGFIYNLLQKHSFDERNNSLNISFLCKYQYKLS